MPELTPMKAQYNEIKAQHRDCLLFFRLGDFYELFDDDARVASKELELALTTRDRGKPVEEQTPMCGVPFHSADTYIAKLIAKGYKVAICEQMEDPALAKGLVSRDVIRIITPGTVTESAMLEEGRANYLAAIYLEGNSGGVAFADVTTGEFAAERFTENAHTHIMNELARFCPKEVLLSPEAAADNVICEFLRDRLCAMPETGEDFDEEVCAGALCAQFGVDDTGALGFAEGSGYAVRAAGSLLRYLIRTQKFDLSHMDPPELLTRDRYMEIDYTTMRNLELTRSMRGGEKKGTLLWVLDKTATPMGSRMLRSWVERPLLNPVEIRTRLSAVAELYENTVMRRELIRVLRGIGDLRRLCGKAVYGTASAKDLRSLGNDCSAIPELLGLLQPGGSAALSEIAGADPLSDVAAVISDAICDDPPFSVREGGMIRPGFNEEVDRLRGLRDHGADSVRELETRERERTGVKKLKVGYNRVFGYYIEIPMSAGQVEVPAEYIRKQTLTSGERYFTPELKELENTLLTAADRLAQLEFELFTALREQVAAQVNRIQNTSDAIARLDCFCALAEVAVRNRYCMPEVNEDPILRISEGRHPVVEAARPDVPFVPNNVFLNDKDDRVAIITGPNMAGKSTYMRQTALIVLMAQIGSFVPAKSAEIGVVDRVFTRIGAGDDLTAGQSTFMMEMSETAAILRAATKRSLLIFDEIGRGTSTYDGMAIARAVLEYCADKRRLGAKTMFATHYHELSALEGALSGVRNYNISAKKRDGTLIFLRKIMPGAADRSYGIEVARLAGLPDGLIAKAQKYLAELESGGHSAAPVPAAAFDDGQISLTDMAADEVRRILRQTDPDLLTPREALEVLYELKRKLD